jgi:hypothetical protein
MKHTDIHYAHDSPSPCLAEAPLLNERRLKNFLHLKKADLEIKDTPKLPQPRQKGSGQQTLSKERGETQRELKAARVPYAGFASLATHYLAA